MNENIIKQTVISPDRNRTIYNKTVEANKGKMVTPGFFRTEQTIANGKSKYDFGITKDSNADSVTEQKLDRNDKFLITHLGFFMIARLSTKTGGEILQTYNNPVVFVTDSTNFISTDLSVFWNGFMAIKVGQTTYMEKFDLNHFWMVPSMQQQAGAFYAINASGAEATSAVVAAATKQTLVAFSERKAFDGFQEVTPQFELDGNGKTTITIEAPVHSTAKVANTNSNTSNILVVMARGFLITAR